MRGVCTIEIRSEYALGQSADCYCNTPNTHTEVLHAFGYRYIPGIENLTIP